MNEIEQILTSIFQCRRLDLYARDLKLSKEQQERYDIILDRRRRGEPLQYILGDVNFMGYTLAVNKDCLIPRPETEILVEEVLKKIYERYSASHVRILELGTGSGNIAIALAQNIMDCHITTVDVSLPALKLARKNAVKNLCEKKIEFVRADMIKYLNDPRETAAEKYDVIVSNPPYIRTDDLSRLPADVRHEPRLALDGGEDGLRFLKEIVVRGAQILKPDGFVALELADGQADAVREIFQRYFPEARVRLIEDYTRTERVVIAERGFPFTNRF